MSNLKEQATKARLKILDLIYKAQSSHIGSNFSCVDILTTLFSKDTEIFNFKEDKFILSAGWKVATFYYFLQQNGRISEDELNSYCQENSKFIGLAEPITEDITFAGGSMGLGLPASVGFALAKKLKGENGKIFCLMSEAECQSGTFNESINIANKYKLDNLKILIDINGLQAMGETKDILPIEFGGHFYDGHSYEEIIKALNSNEMIICFKTIKGKGVSFMENNNIWHYKSPNENEYIKAKEELCLK